MLSILLVEDHVVMGETMAEYLQHKLNADVRVVRSAEAALRDASELDVDLVLIDVSLPDMNGIDLVTELRQRLPDLSCVVVSGHLEPKYVRSAFEAGVQGYVEKGDPDALVKAVKAVQAGEMYFGVGLLDQLSD